jgi:hypothetical protein
VLDPTTSPPAVFTAAAQLASISLPKAQSAVMKNHLLRPASVRAFPQKAGRENQVVRRTGMMRLAFPP